jgi:hypothetical protein
VQCVLALLAITGVFLLVPRGINVGTIEVHSTKMTFNSTTKTYRIILQADVPIYNPNYLKVRCYGQRQLLDKPKGCWQLCCLLGARPGGGGGDHRDVVAQAEGLWQLGLRCVHACPVGGTALRC